MTMMKRSMKRMAFAVLVRWFDGVCVCALKCESGSRGRPLATTANFGKWAFRSVAYEVHAMTSTALLVVQAMTTFKGALDGNLIGKNQHAMVS